jgi:hypothetical protein
VNHTTRRHPRSLAEAFPDERAYAGARYVSNKPSHRLMRFVRNLCRWLTGPRP